MKYGKGKGKGKYRSWGSFIGGLKGRFTGRGRGLIFW